MDRPSTLLVTLLKPARWAAVLGQPSMAFSLIGSNITWLVKYASLHCRKWDQGISLSEPFSSLDFASNYAFSFGLKKTIPMNWDRLSTVPPNLLEIILQTSPYPQKSPYVLTVEEGRGHCEC
jgi:hypothetical protein